MLDGKILAAVLATLTALAATTSGGNIQDAELSTDPSDINADPSGILENPFGELRKVIQPTPEPETRVTATLEAGNLWQESIKFQSGQMILDNTTSIEVGSQTITSDEQIRLYGYQGTVKPSNTTKFSGSTNGVLTSGVNISGKSNINRETGSKMIKVTDARVDTIKLSQVSGNIESDAASTTFKQNNSQNLNIRAFEGDVTIYPANRTLVLDGMVGTFEAGSFSFGN